MGNSTIAAWLQRWWQRVRGPVDASGRRLRRPSVRRYGRYAALQFTRSQTQSRMLADDPDHTHEAAIDPRWAGLQALKQDED